MKYSTIVDYILQEISLGHMASGTRIPSIRDLCSRFSCTKSTVLRAYTALKEHGAVYAVPGSGYYVLHHSGSEVSDKKIIDFSGTSLDRSSLPLGEFQPCVNQAFSKYKDSLFTYADPQGLPALLEAVRKHLQDHQVFTGSERIFITTGSQQTLSLLCKMPFPNGKSIVVVEQPAYQGILQSLKLNGVTVLGVARGFQGFDFEGLEAILRNDGIKFIYTVTRFNNPLGLSCSNEDKKRLLELAQKYNTYIVEDDYIGDLESDAKSTPIFSFDMSDRVVYVKTFSKVMMPGLRIAVAVLPKLLVNTFREYKYWSDLNTPLISQGALEIYLSSGMFNLHIQKVRSLYGNRIACLRRLAEKYDSPAIRWHVPLKNGFYTGMEILNGGSGKAVRESLIKKSILLSDMENYYLQEFYTDKILRLSVANAELHEMESGISAIIDEMEKGSPSGRVSIRL